MAEKKKGWFDKVHEITEEKMKGFLRNARRKEVKSAWESVITSLEIDIEVLKGKIFDAEKSIASMEPRKESHESIEERIKAIGKLQNLLETKENQLVKERVRFQEAFNDGDLCISVEEEGDE